MKEVITGVAIGTVFVLLMAFIVVPKFESDAENQFNKTFDAVKSNTYRLFSKTNMTGTERTDYIINTCQIVFGNGNYREGDVGLCKTKMGLK